ncbi:hypothetical protein [Chromobacterium piscinae]|uniref:hypothetical protein n=1 Tax=Chromobacterium piscinae TaxID=686831 RepID=UPI001C8BA37D|nr:hypothetical protein [Chromobacterium vaccinii]MBX9355835.1 hypothetical protein [Chromobacterium vaccinii]
MIKLRLADGNETAVEYPGAVGCGRWRKGRHQDFRIAAKKTAALQAADTAESRA